MLQTHCLFVEQVELFDQVIFLGSFRFSAFPVGIGGEGGTVGRREVGNSKFLANPRKILNKYERAKRSSIHLWANSQ